MDKDELKNRLASHLRQKPSDSFTQKVMNTISFDADEVYLKQHLKEGLLHKTTSQFTISVLNKVTQQPTLSKYQPVINKKGWIFIGSLMILIIVLSFNQPESDFTSKYLTIMIDFINLKISSANNILVSNNFLLTLVVSIFSLFFLEAITHSNRLHYK